jgi:hypothetical protein
MSGTGVENTIDIAEAVHVKNSHIAPTVSQPPNRAEFCSALSTR